MARTRSTRRRPTLAQYHAHQRTPAHVAARVPPTRDQFHRAFDYGDDATILDFLVLNADAQRALDETNARLMRNDGHYSISDAWSWPASPSRRLKQRSLLEETAACGWIDILEWFFSNASVERWPFLIRRSLEGMLAHAMFRGQFLVVETLLTSSVFVDLLSLDEQQHVLATSRSLADDALMQAVLVAHGASEAFQIGARTAVRGCEYSDSNRNDDEDDDEEFARDEATRAIDHFNIACRENLEEAKALVQQYIVVDPAVLIDAVEDYNVPAVTLLLSEGFVDVDAQTPLIACAGRGGLSPFSPQLESRQAIVRTLFEYNADPTLRDVDDRTALYWAVFNSDFALVDLLLEHMEAQLGADAVHADHDALGLACRLATEGNRDRIIELVLVALLMHGACVTACDRMLADKSECIDVEDALSTLRPCRVCRSVETPKASSKRKREESK